MCLNHESRNEARMSPMSDNLDEPYDAPDHPLNMNDPNALSVALEKTLKVMEQTIEADLPADAPTPELDAALTGLMGAMGIPKEAIAISQKATHAAGHIDTLERVVQDLAAEGDFQTADQILDALLDSLHSAGDKAKTILESKSFETAAQVQERRLRDIIRP